MADILIEWIETDTPGEFPTAAMDAQGPHNPWDLNNEAVCWLLIPDKFVVGSNLVLKIKEATLGESLKHKWQATVLLNGVDSAVYTSEVTSSGTADTLTTRQITISTSSAIDGTAIAAGDLLSITLERIAASASEDSNPIRVYASALVPTTDDFSVSPCGGDVGDIVDAVALLSNDTRLDFAKAAEIITWINECTGKIARRGYWRKRSDLSLAIGIASYDLLDDIPDYEKIYGAWTVSGTTRTLYAVARTREEFEEYRDYSSAYVASPTYNTIFIEGNTLEISPTPTATATLKVDHSYCPADVDCLENSTVPVPRAHKSIYTNFCRWKQSLKDRDRADAAQDAATYKSDFKTELDDLVDQGFSDDVQARPYR